MTTGQQHSAEEFRMSTTAARDSLLRLLAPVVTAGGAELEDVTVTTAGKRRLVRVVVDRDGGVGLDQVADLSQAVSEALDGAETLRGPYVLEVTSPGVDRPLTEPRHWRRAAARLVKVRLADGGEVTGRVVRSDEAGVTLEVAGDERELTYKQIGRATVQVEFARAGTGPGGQPAGEQGPPGETAKE
jgi:ribosome maturation factor RimP